MRRVIGAALAMLTLVGCSAAAPPTAEQSPASSPSWTTSATSAAATSSVPPVPYADLAANCHGTADGSGVTLTPGVAPFFSVGMVAGCVEQSWPLWPHSLTLEIAEWHGTDGVGSDVVAGHRVTWSVSMLRISA